MGDLSRSTRDLKRRIRVASNLYTLQHATCDRLEIEFVRCEGRQGGLRTRIRRSWRALRCDYVVINSSPRDLYDFCLLRMILPFMRCKVVSLDTVLPVPPIDTLRQRISLGIKRRLFRRVHLFIEYFKETDGYERHYGIPRHRFRHVSFKINRYEKVLQMATRDDGYIFCGGNTRRDFATLIEAARGFSYPVKIVTMRDAVISGHGSSLDERNMPPNVEVIRHDGSDSFLDYVAGARLAVLPIRAQNISASGIGVYLTCMALGKCVVISAGPAVNGVVPDGAAVIVPPEDPDALRAAIDAVYRDAAYRERVANAGQRYALSLGGEDRLCASVAGVLADDALPGQGRVQAARARV